MEEAKKDSESVVKIMGEMWNYLKSSAKAFHKWIFTIFDYTIE
jgi:hypothetical protein